MFMTSAAVGNFETFCVKIKSTANWERWIRGSNSPNQSDQRWWFFRLVSSSQKCLEGLIFFCFIFVFSRQLQYSWLKINFADGWIQTADLWCLPTMAQPLPLGLFFFCFIFVFSRQLQYCWLKINFADGWIQTADLWCLPTMAQPLPTLGLLFNIMLSNFETTFDVTT